MRALVIGSRGQLGSDLVGVLQGRNETAVLGLDLPDMADITDPASVELVLGGFDPDVVVNCAAWTAVDQAETHEEAALLVNGVGPRVVAAECHKAGAWLVQISTDYVFDGLATSPYAEDATPDPRSAYGRTKLAARSPSAMCFPQPLPRAHRVVYGRNGTNFVKTMARLEAPQR